MKQGNTFWNTPSQLSNFWFSVTIPSRQGLYECKKWLNAFLEYLFEIWMSDMNDNRRNIMPLEYFNAEFTYSTFVIWMGFQAGLAPNAKLLSEIIKEIFIGFCLPKLFKIQVLKSKKVLFNSCTICLQHKLKLRLFFLPWG